MKQLPLLLLLLASNVAAIAAKPFTSDSIVLLQPTGLLAQRVETADLSTYIGALKARTDEAARSLDKTARTGFVVFAIRPDKTRKIWLDLRPAVPEPAANSLIAQLEAVDSCAVRRGTVVAAFSVRLWGGKAPALSMPAPVEWNEFLAGKGTVEVTQLVDTLWPPNPGVVEPPPAVLGVGDFVPQILEPTGGKISRPKDWFYSERHRGPVYDWTISREDTANGSKPYITGVRIQFFNGIKKGTGKSPEEFIQDFIGEKKKEAEKVLSTCEPQKQDFFTRSCMETEEAPFHIQYAMYWSNNGDLAVVAIFGTTKELWTTFASTFDRMGTFELFDTKRFE